MDTEQIMMMSIVGLKSSRLIVIIDSLLTVID